MMPRVPCAPGRAPNRRWTVVHTDPAQIRAFFAARAADWETRYPDDAPAYRAGVAELGLREGQAVLDAGCGTGRALPFLRAAVGASGTVVGADLTPEMLAAAAGAGRREHGALLLADCARLPLRDHTLDAVFAAGLIGHLPDPGPVCANWPGSPGPAAGWPSSTRSAGRRWPPGRAGNSPRTTCVPSPTWGPC